MGGGCIFGVERMTWAYFLFCLCLQRHKYLESVSVLVLVLCRALSQLP